MSDEVSHLFQQAFRRDVQRYELEAAVWFMIEDDRAGLLRLSGVGPPDDNPGGSRGGDGFTLRDQRAEGLCELAIETPDPLRDQRAEGLCELAIETPDPGVIFLDPQNRMTLVNRTLEFRFALRYLHLIFPFLTS
ncbi:MAG: hypothetical protein ACYSTT_23195 [Planctomycetota bacterium]